MTRGAVSLVFTAEEQADVEEAARLLQARADAARPGPYWLDTAPEEHGEPSDTGSLLGPSTTDEVQRGADECYELGNIYPLETAQHLVHFSPAFAQHLAEWLTRIASGRGLNCTYPPDERMAVHLSRLYLGKTTP